MRQAAATIRLLRPGQWAKNVFVLTALLFSGQVIDPEAVARALLAFLAFCLASSAVYLFNDFCDREEDRRHPTKKDRPLAGGDLPAWIGPVGAAILAAAALALGILPLDPLTGAVIALYMVLNAGYSLGLKHIVIIDVLIIASGFVLRILAGATALRVLPSTWLILCAVTISLFLGFTKRRAEVMLLGDRAGEYRRVLVHYSTAFLDQMISIVTAATVVCYALYTVDDRTVILVGSRLLLLSVPLVLYGIFRYLYLVYHGSAGDDPTRTIFTDMPLLVTGVLWGTWCTMVILFGERIVALL